jgi:hypothetical protein
MKSVMFLVALLLPATLIAQERDPPRPGVEREARASSDPDTAVSPAAGALLQRTPAPPPTPPGARRRPSMVGYIDDATIETKVRVRFDVGYHVDAPDRAEFFYAKCGCYRGLPPNVPAFDPNAQGPGPGVLTDLNFQQLYVEGEYAFHPRVSVIGDLPVRWLQPQTFVAGTGGFGDQRGISDFRAGVKLGALASDDLHLTLKLQAIAPTGRASRGLGTNHWTIEAEGLYSQTVAERLGVEAEIGTWHPTGGSAGVPTSNSDKFSGDVFFYGVGPSYDVYRNDRVRFAPVVELVGWHVLNGFQTVTTGPPDASGINIVNLKVGGRATFRDGSSIYAGYGHALTKADWYKDIVRLEYRRSF